MYYQQSLFSQQIYELDQRNAADLLADINAHLWACVANPFDELIETRRTDPRFRALDEGGTAQFLHYQIVDRAKMLFADNDAIVFRQKNQQKYFEYKELICIHFKKVTPRRSRSTSKAKLERSNYMTRQNKEYWNQSVMQEFPELPRLLIGYEFIDEMTDIRVHVCYPRTRGKGFIWVYEMANQDAELKLISQDTAIGAYDNQDEPTFTIKPRIEHGAQRDQG